MPRPVAPATTRPRLKAPIARLCLRIYSSQPAIFENRSKLSCRRHPSISMKPKSRKRREGHWASIWPGSFLKPSRCMEASCSRNLMIRTHCTCWVLLPFRGGILSEALARFDAAIRIDASNPEIHNTRGVCLNLMRRSEEAVASYERAIRLDPNYAAAHQNRGIALKELGRFEEALASYDRAIAAKPDDPVAYYGRAILLNTSNGRERRSSVTVRPSRCNRGMPRPTSTAVTSYASRASFRRRLQTTTRPGPSSRSLLGWRACGSTPECNFATGPGSMLTVRS